MLKVKIFDEEHEEDLEEKMNEFLATIPEENIKNINYQVSASHSGEDQIFCFSAMVIYRKVPEEERIL